MLNVYDCRLPLFRIFCEAHKMEAYFYLYLIHCVDHQKSERKS